MRPAAAARTAGAGGAVDATAKAAARIADICTPDGGCRYPQCCDPGPAFPQIRPTCFPRVQRHEHGIHIVMTGVRGDGLSSREERASVRLVKKGSYWRRTATEVLLL